MEQMEIEEPRQQTALGSEEALLDTYRRKCRIGYKWQMVIIISLVVLLAAGMFMVVNKKNRSGPNSSNLLCNTTECILTATHIQSFVNPSKNPCDNFYKFACGNFHMHYDTNNITVASMHRKNWNSALLSLVVDKNLNETKWKMTKNLKLARKFYRSCMDVTAPHKQPDLAFLEGIDYITGGWPQNQKDPKFETWWNVMLKSRQIGMNFDFFLNVNITKFPNAHLQISPPNVDLMKLFHKIWIPENKGYIRTIVEYWGYYNASLFWEFDEIKKFADELMEAVLSSYLDINDIDNKSTTLTKISDLTKSRDYDPDWLPVLQNLTNVFELKETELVSFKIRTDSHENYLSKLSKLIENTPTRHWINYVIAYQIVREYQYLSRTVQLVVNKIMEVAANSSRHDFCIFETGKYFYADIEKVLVNQIATPQKIQNIRNMYNHITKAFERHLKQAYASNDIIRDGSIGHLQNLSFQIGGNDYFFNDKLFEETFGVKPDEISDNAIETLHVLEKFRVDHILSCIRTPTAIYNRSLNIADMALTYTWKNSIFILAPLLQEPTYSLNRPEYVNYGSLGTMIAHEIMRVYDDRIFDMISFGTFPNWQARLKRERKNALGCANQFYIDYYQKQFNSTKIPPVNEELSILDYGSANIAYMAYLDYVNASDTEQNITGVSYDHSQVFWIMASTYYCNTPKLEETEDAWTSHYQTFQLPSFRINGPKMNSPYFPQHFNCSLGTTMNPNKKCTPFP